VPARIVRGHDLQRRLLAQAAAAALDGGVTPSVALVRVQNDDPMTPVNFALHHRLFAELGFRVQPHELPRGTTPADLESLVDRLNDDETVDVVLVLIPLPAPLDIRLVLDRIAPAKEAEGLHLDHVIRLNPLSARPPTRIPVVPTAVVHLLTEIGLDPEGGEVVVLTDPELTETNPVAKMVARVAAFSALPPGAAGAAVPVTHPRARELTRRGDLLIVSLQQAGVVTGEWVKPGATVIDFNPVFLGWRPSRTDPARQVPHLVGGVDVESVTEVAGTLVPAPGGVGPVMLGALAQQIVSATEARRAQLRRADGVLVPS